MSKAIVCLAFKERSSSLLIITIQENTPPANKDSDSLTPHLGTMGYKRKSS